MLKKTLMFLLMGGVHVGSPFGVPLHVQSVTIMTALVMLAMDLKSGFVFLAAMLAVVPHEYGHALAGKLFGYKTTDIQMTPIGGMARIDLANMKPIEELIITAAGPLVNLMLGFFCLLVAWAGESWFGEGQPFEIFAMINFAIAIFNLLPLLPMDGGRMLRSGLGLFGMDLVTATFVTFMVGFAVFAVVSTLLIIAGNVFTVIVLAVMLLAGWVEVKRVRQKRIDDIDEECRQKIDEYFAAKDREIKEVQK